MSQVIPVSGSNKKLLHQCAYISYRANRAADKNRWNAFTRLIAQSNRKLLRIAYNLGINTDKFDIKPNELCDGLILTPREGQA